LQPSKRCSIPDWRNSGSSQNVPTSSKPSSSKPASSIHQRATIASRTTRQLQRRRRRRCCGGTSQKGQIFIFIERRYLGRSLVHRLGTCIRVCADARFLDRAVCARHSVRSVHLQGLLCDALLERLHSTMSSNLVVLHGILQCCRLLYICTRMFLCVLCVYVVL
jgi:hypothetical protein